jgi:soluble lytic murein transglycosylase-like protein
MLVDRFDGDLTMALAAYNMGPTALAKLAADHPGLSSSELVQRHAPRATARYVRDILGSESPRLPPADR